MFDDTLTKLMAVHGPTKGCDKWAEKLAASLPDFEGCEDIEWEARCYNYSSSSDLATVQVIGTKDDQPKEIAFVAAGHADASGTAEDAHWLFMEDENGPVEWADLPDYKSWM